MALRLSCGSAGMSRSLISSSSRVGGDEQEFDFLFQFRAACLALVQFLAGHVAHLRVALVGDDIFRLVDAAEHLDVFFAGRHEVAQLLVLLRQLDVAFLVGDDGRVGYQGGHFLVAGHEGVEFLE